MMRYAMLPIFLISVLLLSACEQRGPIDITALEGRARNGDSAAIEQMVELLDTTENDLNMRVYKFLLSLGKAAEPALLQEIATKKIEKREYVIAALGTLQSRAAVAGISTILADKELGRRYIAAWALGEIKDPAGIPSLLVALGDPDGEVWRYATRSLIKFNREAVAPLLRVLTTGSATASAAAIRALGDIGDERALDALLSQMSGENRIVVIKALGKLKDKRAASALIAALTDRNWRVRMNAAMALGPLGGSVAAEPLRKTLEDEVRVVREWSARSLEMITGERVLYRNNAGEYVTPYHIYH